MELFTRLPVDDRTYLEACGLAAEGVEQEVWKELYSAIGNKDPLAWSDAFSKISWRLQSPAAVPSLVKRATSDKLSSEQRALALDTIAFTRSQSAADAMAKLAAAGNPGAQRWLWSRAWGEWKSFGMLEKMKELGIYDPDNTIVTTSVLPPLPKESSLPPIDQIVKLKGDAHRGEAKAALCYVCHQIDGKGVVYGPDLKGWVSDQGLESFLTAVIKPSASIAHGYSGADVILEDGGHIHGLAFSRTDPVIVQSMGGVTQIIPGEKVKKVARLKQSLMLSADQLGLSAQDLADLAAYLKTYR